MTLIIVNCQIEPAARFDCDFDVLQRLPHGSGVVQYAPGVNDVERANCFQIILVESGGAVDPPLRIIRKIAAL